MSACGDGAVEALFKFQRHPSGAIGWSLEDEIKCREAVEVKVLEDLRLMVINDYEGIHENIFDWVPTAVGAIWNPMGRTTENYISLVAPATLMQVGILEMMTLPDYLWLDFSEKVDRRFLFRAAARTDLPYSVQEFLAKAPELSVAKRVSLNKSFPDHLRAMATFTVANGESS